MNESQIFVSHASPDVALVDALRDLMVVGMGVPQERIFCTSLEGTGIPEGQSFVPFIKSKLQTPALVLMVVTPSYYESAFCLCELGAAWAMAHNSFPLMIPPVDSDNLKAVLHGTQVGELTNEKALDRLFDRVKDALKIKGVPTATWNVKRDQFLKKLPRLLKGLAGFKKVDFGQYEAMRQNYEAASEELATANQRIEELEAQIEEIGKLKDKKEVAKIQRRGQRESELLDELTETARERLARLPDVVIEAMYYQFSGGHLAWPGFGEEEKRADMRRAVENTYLVEGDRVCTLNERDPAVAKALDAVQEVAVFLGNASEELTDEFTEEYDFEPRIDSRRFWQARLGLS
ncbi:toll/interleukin-1 receptor domain-containing protein [Pyxidicoccus caerfyrddinensis]|uniref:toll/interleukin-1 receptor domain-containing protein n=1 Tax=Pyxidicoccus caerfyrddinensis TaxID=2709663 RepID=UPI0013DAFC73|nr:TIR domain-containing protein [Pyxidicoccus caerfyrddinensis]